MVDLKGDKWIVPEDIPMMEMETIMLALTSAGIVINPVARNVSDELERYPYIGIGYNDCVSRMLKDYRRHVNGDKWVILTKEELWEAIKERIKNIKVEYNER